jgi:microcystin-dependent protein
MSDPFVAEIRIFPFDFAPTGWAFCNGQLLPISQNTALFSLLGTFYGGDGKSTFALPDLQGSVAMHAGQGLGLSDRFIGEQSGSDHVTLIGSEMPVHTHSLRANPQLGDSPSPAANRAIARLGSINVYQTTSNASLTNMAFEGLPVAGGDQPHNNLMPYLTLNYCIALQGIFPPRS